MLICDFNGIAIAAMTINKTLDENLIRHMILNSIRMYRVKFPRKDYGDVIIACDGANSWRKEYYPQYKANRHKDRSASTFDWKEAFRILNKIREEIKETFPYKVIHLERVEADDVIGTLVYNTQEFGNYENCMIVSSDHDFAQLQKFDNVKQYSPSTKKLVKEPNPKLKMLTHIIRGDAGDGVPNVLSADNVFVESIRQTTISAKKFDEIADALQDTEKAKKESWYRNYERNRLMVDLEFTPDIYKQEILKSFESQDNVRSKGVKILPYLINKKCKLLIEVASEFI